MTFQVVSCGLLSVRMVSFMVFPVLSGEPSKLKVAALLPSPSSSLPLMLVTWILRTLSDSTGNVISPRLTVADAKLVRLPSQVKVLIISSLTSSVWFYVSMLFILMGTVLFLAGFIGELVCRNSTTRNQYLIEKDMVSIEN